MNSKISPEMMAQIQEEVPLSREEVMVGEEQSWESHVTSSHNSVLHNNPA